MLKKIKLQKFQIIEILALILSPLISTIIFFFGILGKKRKSFIFFIFFISLLGYLLIPYDFDDLTRHYEFYEQMKILEFDNDVIYNSILYFFKILKFPKEIIPFFAVLITNGIYLKIYLNILPRNISTNRYYITVIIFICNIISFKLAASNIRMPVACAVMSLGIWNISIDKKIKGWIYCILTIGIHFMMIPYVLILLIVVLSKQIKLKRLKVFFLFSLIFGKILTIQNLKEIFIYFNNFLDLNLQDRIIAYTEGYWAKEYLEVMSFKGMVAYYLANSMNWIKIIYILNSKKNKFIVRYILISFSFAWVLQNLSLIRDRYMFLGQILINFIFIGDIIQEIKIGNLKKFFIITSIVYFIAGLYSQKECYFNTVRKLGFNPMIRIFFINTSKEEYIKKH